MGNFISPFLTLLLTRQLGKSDAEAAFAPLPVLFTSTGRKWA